MRDKEEIGRFISKKRNKWRVRVPNHNEVVFHIECLSAAIHERDLLCEIDGIDPYDLVRSKNNGWIGRPCPNKVHTDLPRGLTRCFSKYKNKSYPAIVALINTKYQKKYHYGHKRTEAQAIKIAKIWHENFKDKI